jgi:hypothetical protein
MTASCRIEPGTARPASWIIATRRGRALYEVYDPSIVFRVNAERYTVWTIRAWLAEVNRRIRAQALARSRRTSR